ncbi:helix-turn-helix transcriptional regulator [Synergistes jonesii]|uniref:helix-turn-helix transcriptional regulator n=1 Tax=Synergistes jonesii TaxID=2754 RepID=UPI00191C1C06|nr:HTH domain-containing protein [Synergistes jonesii]
MAKKALSSLNDPEKRAKNILPFKEENRTFTLALLVQKKVESAQRNPGRKKLILESWGRGIEKICNALKSEYLPMPEDRVVRVTNKVTDRESQVLQYLMEDPGYTMPLLANKMGVSRKSIAGYLKALKEKMSPEAVQGLFDR